MGIAINTGFDLGAGVSIDSRFILTKAQMLAMNDNIMPDVYPAWDKDTGDSYIYKKSNSADPVTGKFRKLEAGGASGDVVTYSSNYASIGSTENVGKVIIYSGAETGHEDATGHVFTVAVGETVKITTVAGFISYLQAHGKDAELLEYPYIDPNMRLQQPTKSIVVGGTQYYIGWGGSGIYSFANPGELLTPIDPETLSPTSLDDEAIAALGLELPTSFAVTDLTPKTPCVELTSELPTITPELITENKMYAYVGSDTGIQGHIFHIGHIQVNAPAYKAYNGSQNVYLDTNSPVTGAIGKTTDGEILHLIVEGTTITTEEYPGDSHYQWSTSDIGPTPSGEYISEPAWIDVTKSVQVFTLPTANINNVGKVYQYIGSTTQTYTLGHFYRCTEVTESGSTTYKWQELDTERDDAYVEHFSVMPEPGETYLGHLVQYYGTDTENFKCGHFYKCVSDGGDPATYAWEGVDTESDTYDDIEARPLILTKAEELGTATVSATETTATLTGVVLSNGVDYSVKIGNAEAVILTAALDGTAVKLTGSNFTITTAEGASNSTVKFDTAVENDTVVVVSTVPYVTVNPDYADFFNKIGAESSLDADITANIEVGGIADGQTLAAGTTFTDVIRALLVKYFAPTITMASDKALLNKKGTTITQPIEISATSVKKSLDITSTIVKNPEGTTIASGTTATGETVTATWETDISTDTTFTATVTDGRTPVNATLKFEFVNPYVTGASDTNTIEDFTGLTEEIVKRTAKKVQTYTAVNKYLVFAYDASYGNLTSIMDQNNFENLSAFTKSVVTVGGEDYNVYVSNTPITCTAFKYTFIL